MFILPSKNNFFISFTFSADMLKFKFSSEEEKLLKDRGGVSKKVLSRISSVDPIFSVSFSRTSSIFSFIYSSFNQNSSILLFLFVVFFFSVILRL